MIKDIASVAFCLLALHSAPLCCMAENLVPGGDFTEAKKGKIGWCRREMGAFSLFNEEYTWNNCGKLEIRETYTNGNALVRSAVVTIGQDGKFNGFAVKPNTRYDFSVDLRGGVKSATIRAISWNGDNYWKDRRTLKVSPNGSAPLEDAWRTYKGSFLTPPDAKRAALQVSIWSGSKGGGKLYEAGDFVLVDNVKVEVSRNNFSAQMTEALPARKAIATGDGTFDDFVNLRNASVPAAKTTVRPVAVPGAFGFEIVCDEPRGVSAKDDGSVWSGDSVEVWFGPVGSERHSTQLGVGANGSKYAAADGKRVDANVFEARVEKRKNSWTVRMKVPFAAVGWKADAKKGDSIAFNVGRHRRNARAYETWSPLTAGFQDVEHFGELVYDDYAAAFKNRYLREAPCKTRSEYETQAAAAEKAEREAKFAKFKDKRFSVAPVPVTSDFAIPFLPPEIFDPPEEIRLVSAINERKALALAIANLSDRVEDYVVVLETAGRPNVGERGLKGFPNEKLTVRKALRMKDSSAKNPTLRLDPLPGMDDAGSITIPPKEASLVWFDFDTTGVAPGRYPGRLRVIPLGGYGAFKNGKGYDNITYSGEMQTIPVELEVRPIVLPLKAAIPTGFFMEGLTEEAFGYQVQLGAEYFNISPWGFAYEKTAEGNIDLDRPTETAKHCAQRVRAHLEWGKKLGFRPKFLVCYSSVYAFRNVYRVKQGAANEIKLWSQYVLGVKKLMNSCGVDDSEYAIETYDEPPANDYASIRAFHEAAKKAAPTVRLEITLGHRKMTVDELRKLGEVTDEWIVWDSYFREKAYRELFAQQSALGKTIRHYTCDTSPRPSLDSYFRKKAWFGEKYKLHGNMMYQFYDRQGGIGARDFKTPTSGGIGYFLYRRFVPSIRFMAFREGITDLKYIACLREIAGADKDVEAFVAEAVARALDTCRHDPRAPDRLREKIAKMILEKTGK